MMAMGKPVITVLLLLFTCQIESQVFDFYSTYPDQSNRGQKYLTLRRPHEYFTTSQSAYNHDKQENIRTTTSKTITNNYNDRLLNIAVHKNIPFSSFLDVPESDSKKRFFAIDNENVASSVTTTVKTTTRRISSHRNKSNRRKYTSTDANFGSDFVRDGNRNDKYINENENSRRPQSNSNQNQFTNNISSNNNNNNYDLNINRNNNLFNDNNYNRSPFEGGTTKSPFDGFINDYNSINGRPNTDNTNVSNRPNNDNINVNNRPNNDNINVNNRPNNDNVYDRPNNDNFNVYNRPNNDNVYRPNNDNINYNNRATTTTTVRPRRPTTESPFYNRPGVRPAFVNGPPITNRPTVSTTNNYNSGTFEGISFPDNSDNSPVLMTGPDDENLSRSDKRRLLDLAEKMCDRWRSLDYKQVQAIPLLPSPDAVRVNVTECSVATPLIVGGRIVNVEHFPHQAAVGWRKREGRGYSWKCGGALISESYVLTAAHCSYQERDNEVDTGPPQAVQLGTSRLDSSNAVIYKVTTAIRHPKYKLPRSYYDVALLKLAGKVGFSKSIRPACLGDTPAVGQKVVATGWGRTEFGGDQSSELRGVAVTVWDITKCRSALGTSRKLPDGPTEASQFCAGETQGGKDTCQGDSGGAAVVRSGCVWQAVGVTSLGRGCGSANVPAVYARVLKTFIAQIAFS